jgi:spore maturation protein B
LNLETICSSIVPAVIALCGGLILISKKPLFNSFLDGAKKGFNAAVGLFPTLCVLFCAVSMFTSCGIVDTAVGFLARLGIPDGLAPFLLMRPVSGAASTAMLADIFSSFGPDSAAGLSASVIMASSDTLIYVVSVYYSAAKIQKSRCTIAAAVITMLVTIISAIIICKIWFK